MGTNLREYRQKKKVTVQPTAKTQRTPSPMTPRRGGHGGGMRKKHHKRLPSPAKPQRFSEILIPYLPKIIPLRALRLCGELSCYDLQITISDLLRLNTYHENFTYPFSSR